MSGSRAPGDAGSEGNGSQRKEPATTEEPAIDEPRDEAIAAQRARLRHDSIEVSHHGRRSPMTQLRQALEWSEEQDAQLRAAGLVSAKSSTSSSPGPDSPDAGPDVGSPGLVMDSYGEGAVIEDFERQIAELLGLESARFMPSGTMAQGISMRIWSERRGTNHIAMHPTAHLEGHEERGYEHVHGLRATLVGPEDSCMLREHLDAELTDGSDSTLAEPVGALLTELPAREIGGLLPTWDELEDLKAWARDHQVPFHLDGARLWECVPAYGRPLDEVVHGFDSVYVSFYKAIGAFSGAMLLGPADFIDEAKIWQRRMGGTLYTALPNVASARANFDAAMTEIPSWHERARQLAAGLAAIEGVRVVPDPPQVSMFHFFVPLAGEDLLAARDRVAQERGIWLFTSPWSSDDSGSSRFEMSVGRATMRVSVDELVEAWQDLVTGPTA